MTKFKNHLCVATTLKGTPCRSFALKGAKDGMCLFHSNDLRAIELRRKAPEARKVYKAHVITGTRDVILLTENLLHVFWKQRLDNKAEPKIGKSEMNELTRLISAYKSLKELSWDEEALEQVTKDSGYHFPKTAKRANVDIKGSDIPGSELKEGVAGAGDAFEK